MLSVLLEVVLVEVLGVVQVEVGVMLVEVGVVLVEVGVVDVAMWVVLLEVGVTLVLSVVVVLVVGVIHVRVSGRDCCCFIRQLGLCCFLLGHGLGLG